MASFFKFFIYFALGFSTFTGVTASAQAGSRYGTPPPVVLSPNQISPWMLQLRAHPLPNRNRVNGYNVGVARPVYRQRVYRQPVYQPPVYQRPVIQRRTYQRPVYQRPVYQRKVYQRPVYQRTTRQPIYLQQRRTINTYHQPAAPKVYAAPPAPTRVKKKAKVQQASIQPAKKKKSHQLDPRFEPQIVSYATSKKSGSIIIDTNDKYLYLVMGDGQARRYGVGVGKPGFEWAGTHKVTRKAEWPSWNPPAQMIAREKKKGRILPKHMPGGPNNPLGARALYLGSTLYRIHGTNSPWTIGKAVSSGCIRMRNEDVMDLYERVGVGTRVTVS